MQDPASANNDLSELERQLAALAPTGRLDRDRLMYAAGRRAGQRRLRATQRWLAVTSAGFGAVLAFATLNPLWSVDRWPDGPPAFVAQQTEPATASQPAARFDRGSSDPSTNFRLLQQLAAGAPRESPRSDHSETPPDAAERDAGRSDSRWLLNRYLDDPRTRL
jgi:hypothetical protein